ncbi:MAG: tetratricopeptide repeat protein, partial [Bacteroidota bacterium]
SYVLEEQYQAAISYYREVVKYPEGTFYQDARWELANAYLELGKKRQARKLLERIAAQAGDYQQAAQAQLTKLR